MAGYHRHGYPPLQNQPPDHENAAMLLQNVLQMKSLLYIFVAGRTAVLLWKM